MLQSRWTLARRWSSVAVWSWLTVLLACGGCGDTTGGGTAKDSIKGKVTMDGSPVMGQIVFVDAKGKEFTAALADGSYVVENVPPGEATILIKPLPGAQPPVVTAKTFETTSAGGAPKMPVAPPKKYGEAQSSGLKYTVTAGHQTKDIELTP